MSKGKKYRILTAEWAHETNTFSIIPTTRSNFFEQYYLESPEEIERERRNTKSPIGATYEAADRYGWELVVPLCASANPTGRLTSECYEYMANQILCEVPTLEEIETGRKLPLDGILLHLHGAMVSETYEDCEGELLRRMREKLNKHQQIPIMVTLDLHGNITELMTEMSTLLLAVRTYPHIDFYETAERAAILLQDTLEGKIAPITVIAKAPMLMGLDGGKTHQGSPMTELIKRSEVLEKNGDILIASVCAGFTAADIREIGPSVTITVDLLNPNHQSKDSSEDNISSNAKLYARNFAEEFMKFAWETREYKSEVHRTVDQTVEYARNYISKIGNSHEWKPLVIADVTDNPGSGHYGDATNLLKGMVEGNLQDVVFYAIYDADAVKQGIAIGVGNHGTITIGGRTDPSIGGAPLTLKGKVVSLTDGCFQTYGPMGFGGIWQNFGLSMLFRVGRNIDIIVISNNGQLLDIAQITSLGCDPYHKKVISVKSKQHYKASLQPMAGEIITVDGGGLGSAILTGGEYRYVRRPIWPLDII